MTLISKNNSVGNTTLVEFSTVLGAMVLVKDREAIKSVAAKFGDNWKKGYTGKTGMTKEATEELVAKGITMYEGFTGKLIGVRYDEGTDGRNTFRKVRVTIAGNSGKTLLTLPLNGDVAPKLLTKLDNVSSGSDIQIKIWMAFSEEKDGVRFANPGVSVKGPDGVEVPISGLSAKVSQARETARAACATMSLTGNAANTAVKNAVEKLLVEHLRVSIEPKFAAEPDVAQSTQVEATADDIGY